jgi:hypothetical protein
MLQAPGEGYIDDDLSNPETSATTLNVTTFSITTLSITIFSIMTLSITFK